MLSTVLFEWVHYMALSYTSTHTPVNTSNFMKSQDLAQDSMRSGEGKRCLILLTRTQTALTWQMPWKATLETCLCFHTSSSWRFSWNFMVFVHWSREISPENSWDLGRGVMSCDLRSSANFPMISWAQPKERGGFCLQVVTVWTNCPEKLKAWESTQGGFLGVQMSQFPGSLPLPVPNAFLCLSPLT